MTVLPPLLRHGKTVFLELDGRKVTIVKGVSIVRLNYRY